MLRELLNGTTSLTVTIAKSSAGTPWAPRIPQAIYNWFGFATAQIATLEVL